jgi:hypothetical protein
MSIEIVDAIILAVPVTVNTSMFTASIRVHVAMAVKPGVSIMEFG